MTRLDRGVIGLLSNSWELFTANFNQWAKLVSMIVVPLLVYILGYGLIFLGAKNELMVLTALGGLLAVIGYVAALLAGLWLGIASVEAADRFADKKTYKFRRLWSLSTWSLIIQTGVAALIYATTLYFGLFLFIIPGILFAIWFLFTKYAVILDKKNDLFALQYSYQIVKGRWWQVFWRCFGFGILMMIIAGVVVGVLMGIGYAALTSMGETAGVAVGGLLLVVGILAMMYVLTPIAVHYYVSLYRDLKKTT